MDFFFCSCSQIAEHHINNDHYQVLQEVDGKEQLRIVPKLTAEHVCPDNMRKMSVKLAVQVRLRKALFERTHSLTDYLGKFFTCETQT